MRAAILTSSKLSSWNGLYAGHLMKAVVIGTGVGLLQKIRRCNGTCNTIPFTNPQ